MNDWETVRIDQVGKIVTGSTPSPAIVQYWNGEVPFITPTDINESVYVYSTERRLTKLGTSFSRLIPANSVMVVCIGSTIGKTACPLVESVTNQQINTVIPCDLTNPRFLYYTLLRLADSIKQIAGVTAIPIINKTAFSLIEFKLPPLPQQRKIAKILTTVDNLIEKTEALIAKYQSIKQGMMHDLFTRGVDSNGKLRPTQSESPELYKQSELGWIPKEWEVDRIQNVLERIIDYRGKTPIKSDSGIPLITAKNVRLGFIDNKPAEFIAEQSFQSWMTRGIPVKGDVLFTTEAPLGNVAQIATDGRLAFAQRIIILQANNRIHNAFLKFLLMTDSPQRLIRTKGTGSTVEGIKQSVFRLLPIAFPKRIQEQNAIVMRLDSLSHLSEIEQESLRKFSLAKTSLMQDLLTGKVQVTPDAEDKELAHA